MIKHLFNGREFVCFLNIHAVNAATEENNLENALAESFQFKFFGTQCEFTDILQAASRCFLKFFVFGTNRFE